MPHRQSKLRVKKYNIFSTWVNVIIQRLYWKLKQRNIFKNMLIKNN